MITFIFIESRYYKAGEYCLSKVRESYPNAKIDFYIDYNQIKLEDYKKFRKKFNCNFIVRKTVVGGLNQNNSLKENLPKMIEIFDRIYQTCINSKDEWVLILEDDVLIKQSIKIFPTKEGGHSAAARGFGGGSIFKRKKFIDVYDSIRNDSLEAIIRTEHHYSWAGDGLLYMLFNMDSPGCCEVWNDHYDLPYDVSDNIISLIKNTDYAVYHNYKELYNIKNDI